MWLVLGTVECQLAWLVDVGGIPFAFDYIDHVRVVTAKSRPVIGSDHEPLPILVDADGIADVGG